MRLALSLAATCAGALLTATSAVGCGDGGGFPDAASHDTVPFFGRFSLQWTLQDSAGTQVTCAQAGAMSVIALVHDDVDTSSFNETFVCDVSAGNSDVLTLDTYDFEFHLVDANSAILATATPQTKVKLVANQTLALTPLVFTVATAP